MIKLDQSPERRDRQTDQASRGEGGGSGRAEVEVQRRGRLGQENPGAFVALRDSVRVDRVPEKEGEGQGEGSGGCEKVVIGTFPQLNMIRYD